MADLSITITNAFTTHGGGITSKWGDFNWDESNWGANSVVKLLNKFILNTVTPTSDISKLVEITRNETLTIEGDQSNGHLTSGDWNYVFPPSTTSNSDKIVTSYTTSTSPEASYSEITFSTSTWT